MSCLSNRGGRFVEISEYHGGAQRGQVRVPEGHRGAGWLRFEDRVHQYFLAKTEPRVAAPLGIGSVGLSPATELGLRMNRNGRDLNPQKESRSSQVRFDSATFARRSSRRALQSEVNKQGGNSRVLMAESEPRPTRKWVFKWDPYPNMLQISKVEGQARQVT